MKCHRLDGLKQQKFYSVTVLEARNPKSRCGQDCIPCEALDQDNLLFASSGFCVLSAFLGAAWPVAASLQPVPRGHCLCLLSVFSSSISQISLCSSLMRTLVSGVRAQPDHPGSSRLTQLHLQNPFFQIRF